MEAFDTIHSYSAEAALALRDAVSWAGPRLFVGQQTLPYELFFEQVPTAHLSFFRSLSPYYRGSDGICVHGGLDPQVPSLSEQSVEVLMWGTKGFPGDYRGLDTVAYGHWDNAELDLQGWPKPRIIGLTIGLDTISHGVLTAMRLADRQLFQSAQHRVWGVDV